MKKWKIILPILVFILLASAGTIYYFFEMKEYDVADEQVKEITETEYTINLPIEEVEDEINSDEEDSIDNIQDDNSNDDNKDNETDSNRDSVTDTGSADSDTNTDKRNIKSDTTQEKTSTSTEQPKVNEVTVASIKKKYRPTFEDLASQADSKINNLLSRAISEYNEKNNNGEDVSFGYFYSKYNDAGKSLEEKTDVAFEIAYEALENDLVKNGFSASHAKEFREAYEQEKSKRRSALLKKAMERL